MKHLDLIPKQTSRANQIERLAELEPLDIAVIGGGATGVGIVLDAAARGFKAAVFERDDFGHGTSSRSTKLVHGGVRYLEQGNVSLVREALHERGLLLKNAPHVVHPLPTIVPLYQWWEGPYYAAGMKAYDLLAGKLGIERSRWLSREQTLELAPTLPKQKLRGGVRYFDGQFDDTRLLIHLVQTAVLHDAVCLNHAEVREVTRQQGRACGLVAEDKETGAELRVDARVVINAAGPFCDDVRRLETTPDEPLKTRWIAASQGAHIVLPQRFLPGESAIIVPRTPDGRVVFAIPWLGRVLVGTTDIPLDHAPREPLAMPAEIDYLLETVAGYLDPAPTRADVLACFAGVRPLVQADPDAATSKLSREHEIRTSPHGMLSVIGGKWTTYRRMAEDAVDHAIDAGGLPSRASPTAELPIFGAEHQAESPFDWPGVRQLQAESPELAEPLSPNLPYTAAHVVWAARGEQARTVEDVLSRRARALLLDAQAAADCAPRVAQLLAAELGRDEPWQTNQVTAFRELAEKHRC
ncbi:Aerobic glycerol-3-phosphate dehydrogenase [Posidoniimonas corsicana]|uniref:Aerobic glycerol-3-phosphate dehydrogenase n=1 Tax=Posidoniimonas corsicana TaxID=1938618 RepID=A0A5C5V453_9BACT|nr:glycerol-3-phosphate dehydrogenase/oxidase [Posidoniimonas corsicana]TWT32537.1 Aerobic glycerol-3-phosphate dehydrogenase [Posidoniimonas corsicana]